MQLRHAGLVESRRGADGGYRLARPAADITLADVIRAIDGPLAGVSGARPETLDFSGVAEPMRDVWIAVRAALRGVLERVTLADVIGGGLPPRSAGAAHRGDGGEALQQCRGRRFRLAGDRRADRGRARTRAGEVRPAR